MPDLTVTPEDMAHDLRADLALCDAASPGPWRIYGTAVLAARPRRGNTDLVARISVAWRDSAAAHRDTVAIATAREGWPAAIRRALAGEAFKQWVHGWLDAIGVPHDPDPEGTAQHGCRISGRMRHLLHRATAAEAEIVRLQATIHGLTERVANQSELLSQRAEQTIPQP